MATGQTEVADLGHALTLTSLPGLSPAREREATEVNGAVSQTLPGLRSRWTMPCYGRFQPLADLLRYTQHLLQGQLVFRQPSR